MSTTHHCGTYKGMDTPLPPRTITELINNPDYILLSVTEVATLLQRDPRTVRRWVSDGDLPAKILGGKEYISRKAVLQLVDA